MANHKHVFLTPLMLSAVCIIGCKSADTEVFPIQGTVSLDGQAIKDGDIVLQPINSNVPPDAGKIINGVFKFQARVGVKRVEIHANREGKPDPLMKSPNLISIIPARYNTNSELKAEITSNGENRFDFELKSQSAK